jgi:hypothetical protein
MRIPKMPIFGGIVEVKCEYFVKNVLDFKEILGILALLVEIFIKFV